MNGELDIFQVNKLIWNCVDSYSAENVKEQQEFIETKLENYLKDRVNLLETSKRESENILKILGENKEKRFKL